MQPRPEDPDATRVVTRHQPASSDASESSTAPRRPSDSSTRLGPGSVIKDRFVIESQIGHGGMGVVYRARDLRKEETRDRDPYVALKVLSDEFRRDPRMVIALQR